LSHFDVGCAAVAAADHQRPHDALGAAQGRMHQRLAVIPLLPFAPHPVVIVQEPSSQR
jgi:hypothetical protein